MQQFLGSKPQNRRLGAVVSVNVNGTLLRENSGLSQGSAKPQRKPPHAVRTRCAAGTRWAENSTRDILPPAVPDCSSAPAHIPEKNSGTGDTSSKTRKENRSR